MRANLNLSEATRGGVGLEALRAASNAAQIQKCLTRKGLWLRVGRSGVRMSQPGFQPSTAQAALEAPARNHNHGVSEFFSTLLGDISLYHQNPRQDVPNRRLISFEPKELDRDFV